MSMDQDRTILDAQDVATFLDDIGQAKRANDERALTRALVASRRNNRELYGDNMRLRGEAAEIEHG